MAGDQHKRPLAKIGSDPVTQNSIKPPAHVGRLLPLAFHEQRVDHGVAGDKNPLFGNPLPSQRGGRRLRRCKVERRERRRQDAIRLLRKWRPQVAGPQSGLDMPERNLPKKRSERRRQHRRSIALGQHHVGPHVGQHGVNSL